jgi:ABA responsive element binding factor
MTSLAGGSGGGPLSRQGSVYSLTLTEVETQLGEPLRSMNLDDLLRTVLPAAEPATGGKKTVDEVLRDIQQSASSGRHQTMGEMTLEDFLSRAGVAVDGGAGCSGPHWLHQYQPPQQQQQYAPLPRPLGVGAAPSLNVVCRDELSDGFGGFLSQVGGRKRGAAAAGVVERTVERRQKRMIKNRESAARSRARKQVGCCSNRLMDSLILRFLCALHFHPWLRHGRRTPTSWRTRSPGWRRRTSVSGSSR